MEYFNAIIARILSLEIENSMTFDGIPIVYNLHLIAELNPLTHHTHPLTHQAAPYGWSSQRRRWLD